MADTITQEILELLKKHAETSESLNPPKDDPESGMTLLYKAGFTQAIEFFEDHLNSKRKQWAKGPDFGGLYSSAGDFVGTHKLEAIGDVLFGKDWYDNPDQNDDQAIWEICNFVYPHRYMGQCLELGELGIQGIEIGI